MHKLCKHYGTFLGQIGDEAYHDFPTPGALTGKNVESHLRELGFGYRAKYIAETARIVANERPQSWLESLRNPQNPSFGGPKVPDSQHATYKEAHEELLSLKGVGPKVADCVCLMGLGWGESIPVDTHVWQIAQRDYKLGKTKSKTFNKAMYDAVGDHFRGLWGSKYAGWAHSVLFTADLREFSDRMIKKEVTRVVKVKEEKVEDDGEGLSKIGRRKRAATATEIKNEIKVEDSKEDIVMEINSTVKRRRTRARP